MAKVIVTFEDTEDGMVTVDINFDPPVKSSDVATRAQSYAMAVLQRCRKDAEKLKKKATNKK